MSLYSFRTSHQRFIRIGGTSSGGTEQARGSELTRNRVSPTPRAPRKKNCNPSSIWPRELDITPPPSSVIETSICCLGQAALMIQGDITLEQSFTSVDTALNTASITLVEPSPHSQHVPSCRRTRVYYSCLPAKVLYFMRILEGVSASLPFAKNDIVLHWPQSPIFSRLCAPILVRLLLVRHVVINQGASVSKLPNCFRYHLSISRPTFSLLSAQIMYKMMENACSVEKYYRLEV